MPSFIHFIYILLEVYVSIRLPCLFPDESGVEVITLARWCPAQDGLQEGKTDNADIASQVWMNIVPMLQALGMGKGDKKAWRRA